MPEVWFIRHGECTANVGSATRNAEEAQLTLKGVEQAKLVAEYIRRQVAHKLTRIVTSPALRAQQTAELTKNFFRNTPCEVWEVQEFNYLALPEDILTTTADRSHLVKEFWTLCDPFYQYKQKAEAFADFIERAQRILKEVRGCKQDKLVIIFSHQQFMQAVRWLLWQEREVRTSCLQSSEMSNFYHLLTSTTIPNCAILKIPSGLQNQPNLLPIETSHLNELAGISM